MDAALCFADPLVVTNRVRIGSFALAARLPTMFGQRENVEAGGLIILWTELRGTCCRRAADYVDKVLRGTKTAELPVEQPTKFDLVVNLTTARAIGLTIPWMLLSRADEVME